MKTEEVEVYSKAVNSAVVRVPGRRFPGSVVQGDSLSILASLSARLARRAEAAGIKDEEFLANLEELEELLLGRLLHYQAVLDEHGIGLPYSERASESDFVRLLPEDWAE